MEFYSEIRDSIDILEEFRKAIIESDIVLDEIISGIHRSRGGGYNVEFLDYRNYVYGDDLRFVDWKVFLKNERYYIKRFDDNKRNRVFLFLDTSFSMDIGGRILRTLSILAAIANIFLRMKDDVYIVLRDEKIRIGESAGNQLLSVLDEIYHYPRIYRGDFVELYAKLPEIIPQNSIICLFSDLFSEPDRVSDIIRTITGTNTYQYIFHILNKNELNPQQKGLKLFIDPDSKNELVIQCDNIWDEYTQELNRYINGLKNLLSDSGKGKYLLCPEGMSLREILLKFFEKR